MSTERQESKLIRNIGFWPLMGIAYGQIIGAGIMTQTGIAIGMTGTGVVLAYIISAVCTTFQNFPTAILGALYPSPAVSTAISAVCAARSGALSIWLLMWYPSSPSPCMP